MLAWKWVLLSRLGGAVMVIFLAWQAWDYLGPRKPPVGPMRQKVADQLIPKIVEDIRKSHDGIQSAALMHIDGDATDYVSNGLRNALEQSGTFDLQDRTFMEKVRDGLRLKQPSSGSFNAIVKEGQRRGAQGVVYGSIKSFESYPGGAKLELDVHLVDVGDKKTVFEKHYTEEIKPGILNPAAVAEEVQRIHPAQRLLGWLLVILLLPVFSISFIRFMVRKQSNRSNAFTLGIYTVVDAIFAYLLLGAFLGSWFSVVLFIIAVGAAFAYNVFIMGFALKLET